MYVEVLSGAIDGWDAELSGDELVGYALELPGRVAVSGPWGRCVV